MRGVVLCGGLSTRMGSDKGLLKKNKLTWAEIAVKKISLLQLPVVISVNQNQVDAYSKIFSKDELVADDDKLSLKGPLLGLLSVHKKFPDDDLLVLACDMLDMNQTSLHNLLDHQKQTSFEAYVYKTGEKLQPLCGIYTSQGLQKIDYLLQQQQLKKFSVSNVLECMDAKYIPVEEASIKCFLNFNFKEDLVTE